MHDVTERVKEQAVDSNGVDDKRVDDKRVDDKRVDDKRVDSKDVDDTGVRLVPIERLEARICAGAANLTAAEALWLADVAEFDRRQGWATWGCVSCAAWLSWQTGVELRAAHEKVRVARALAEFPTFATEMSTGRLTYSKVRAITRIADAHNAAGLLDLALACTSNQLERFVSAYRRADSEDADAEEAAAEQRSFGSRSMHVVASAGVVEIVIRLPIEAGKAFAAAVDQFLVDEPGAALAQRRADAAVEMAEHAVATMRAEHGDPPRYLATIHLVVEQPIAGSVASGASAVSTPVPAHRGRAHCGVGAGDGTCDDPVAVPIATARRMLCDAATELMAYGTDGNPLRLERLSRRVRGSLKRALQLRDGGCRFPGCTHRGWLDAHHIVHWIDQGPTNVDNLVLLCRRHHRFLHEEHWAIIGDPGGEIVFERADGLRVASAPAMARGDARVVHGHGRTAADGRCPWAGERFDLHYAIAVFLGNQLVRRHRETS